MARYDAGWGQGARGGFMDRPEWGRGGSRGGPVAQPWSRYDRDFGEAEWAGGSLEGVYGPSRYGLGPYHARLRQRRRPDEEIREEVLEALFYDTWVDADAITAEVKDGIVTLRGELPNYEEIRYATDDAWDVDGVIGVRSELTVAQNGR